MNALQLVSRMNTNTFFIFALLIMCLLNSFAVIAQKNKGVIKGRIFITDGSAINVSVELKKQKKIVLTDNKGNFKMQNLPALRDTLMISQ
jgi:hypothetical protein